LFFKGRAEVVPFYERHYLTGGTILLLTRGYLHFRTVPQEHWLINDDSQGAPEITMKKIRPARFTRPAQ